MKKVLIDADCVAYRCAWSTNDKTAKEAIQKTEELMQEVLSRCTGDHFFAKTSYEAFLTGKGNFRNDVSPIYKQNRKEAPKPKHLSIIREYLISEWGAIISVGEEADDLISKAAHALKYDCIVATIDKDMKQLPCLHYNLSYGTFDEVSPWDGLKFFYEQILMGDRIDCIIGIYKVGPKKAAQYLDNCKNELDLYNTCVKVYMEKEDLSEYEATKRVLTNGKLLWLRRTEGEIWEPFKMGEVTKE